MAKVRIVRKQDLKGKTKEVPADFVSTVTQNFLKSHKGTNRKGF